MSTTPKTELDDSKVAKQARHAWYLYDFGNSAYAAVILLAVFSAYFKNVVVGGAEGTRLWGWAVGTAAVVVAVISPILGAIADSSRSKKLFLFIFTSISVVFTALLFFVGPGDVVMAMIFFILAEIGYRGAQVFYDALLVDVSTSETVGLISGKGWAIGMLGGIYGQPLGLELDSLETSRIRAMYASAIEAEIDLTNRQNDLREAFIDLMACNALLPEFNRRRAEMIAQAKLSSVYTDIRNAPLSEDLFYNAAIAGKPWVGPKETLKLFEAYQDPLAQLWDSKPGADC